MTSHQSWILRQSKTQKNDWLLQQIKVALYEFKAHTKHARTSVHESSHENHVRIKIILQTAISNVRHKNWSFHSHILLENELLLAIEYFSDWASIKEVMNNILFSSIFLYYNLIIRTHRISNSTKNCYSILNKCLSFPTECYHGQLMVCRVPQ